MSNEGSGELNVTGSAKMQVVMNGGVSQEESDGLHEGLGRKCLHLCRC